MRCSTAQAVFAPSCAGPAARRRVAAAAGPARGFAQAGAQASRLSARASVAGVGAAALRVAPAAGSRRVATLAVQAASAPDYNAVEFEMEWSPKLVPEGPWKVIEGCAAGCRRTR